MSSGNKIPGKILRDDKLAPGAPWSGIVKKGQVLRIINTEGDQGVDFLCYNASNPEERYHAPNTLKKSLTLKLTKGHKFYSDVARPMFTVIADSYGMHDTIGGCCSGPSNEMLYGVKGTTGCRENFLTALKEHGLGRKDIVPNINFFCNVPVDDRRLEETVFIPSNAKPGDYIDLRAEMDALAVISNCPQVNNPCNSGKPKPIRVVIWQQ